jgi:hypothetical protein
MPALHVTIDGKTVIDGDLGQWTTDPPAILREQLAGNVTPQPWMRCLLLLVATAAVGDQDVTVDIATRDNGWTLEVTS